MSFHLTVGLSNKSHKMGIKYILSLQSLQFDNSFFFFFFFFFLRARTYTFTYNFSYKTLFTTYLFNFDTNVSDRRHKIFLSDWLSLLLSLALSDSSL